MKITNLHWTGKYQDNMFHLSLITKRINLMIEINNWNIINSYRWNKIILEINWTLIILSKQERWKYKDI
jgi:hypothetical protein